MRVWGGTFRKGDQVFASCGIGFGAHAEYKCLPDDGKVEIKPNNLTYEEAAATPVGGTTALRFLKKAKIKKGQKVLIYGASGSVGTYAIQIAKYYGAEVTGICSTTNIEMVKSLGADKVIDYTVEDFSSIKGNYDIVFDAVGKASKSDCKKILSKKGVFLSVWGSAERNPDDLLVLKELIESGKVKPVIDRKYDFEDIPEAHRYVEQFHKKGNVVIRVEHE